MIDHIKSLGDASDSDKAAILSAVTRKPIALGELENLLDAEGLLWHDEITGHWTGPLVSYMTGNSDQLSDGLKELLRHMSKTRSERIDSHLPEWALKCKGLLDGLVLAGVINDMQADAVHALGGGRAYGDVTAAEVAAAVQADDEAKAQAEADRIAAEALFQERANAVALMEELQGLVNTHAAPLANGFNLTTDRAAWAAAIDAIRSNWSV